MDRQIIYSGQVPQTTDLLNTNKQAMIALAKLASDLLGTATLVSGLGCVPTSPASMSVNINPGQIYQLANVDSTAYSAVAADTTHSILKQGILLDAQSFALTAPGTVGYSQNYLIQATYLDNDINNTVLPYYNSANPTQAFNGPAGNGTSQPTTRAGQVSLQLIAGTAAATGTQTTPAVTTGYVGLWVITVANGQTTITSANITQATNAPTLPADLLHSIQQNALTVASDTGSANTYVVSYSPPITTLVDGMVLWFKAKTANTGASTLNVNGLGAVPLVGGAHAALQNGEIVANGKCQVVYKADISSFVLIDCTGGAVQIAPATQSQHALQLGQTFNPNLQFNASGEFGTAGCSFTNFSAFSDTSGGLGTFFANGGTLSNSNSFELGAPVPVGAGSVISMSFDVRTLGVSSGQVVVYIQPYNSAGSALTGSPAYTVPNGSSLVRQNILAFTTPANTAYVRWVVGLTSVSSSGLGIIAKSFKINTGATPANYTQEASLAAIPMPVVGSARNLKMAVATVSATATLTADEICVETSLGGFGYKLASFNKSINLATTGAGGMDTGTAPVSGYVALYAIYNPTTSTAALLAVNATSSIVPQVYGGANMPAGYTASALVSVWPTNGSGQFVVGGQRNRRVSIGAPTVLNTNTGQPSYTSLSLSGAVPPNAISVIGIANVTTNTVGSFIYINIGSDSNGTGVQQIGSSVSVSGNGIPGNFALDLISQQTIYWKTSISSGSPNIQVNISAYEI